MEAFNRSIEDESTEVKSVCKTLLYNFFEFHLARRDIALSRKSENADTERQPIDTVVIHHTSSAPGLRPERLSAIELIRLYAPFFAASKGQFPKGSESTPDMFEMGHKSFGRTIGLSIVMGVQSDSFLIQR